MLVTLFFATSGVLTRLKSSHCAKADTVVCSFVSTVAISSFLFTSNMAMLSETNVVEMMVITPKSACKSPACFAGDIMFNKSNIMYDP